MGSKNFGPGVSGYLDPADRSWSLPVFQAGKPILDKELNLNTDIVSSVEQGLTTVLLPSGFVSGDFLNTTQWSDALVIGSAVADQLKIQPLRAVVNGWFVNLANTLSADGTNILDLGAGPVGAGTKRTDLVVLEVWLKLLSAAPSADGKSPLGRIWWNGNVKIDVAQDAILNFVDDILDGALAAESTKRVQIQYRLRVIPGVDVFSFPYGLDDPAVVANTVPAVAALPDGAATLFPYVNQSTANDSGLWRAGDGNPANALGTVDGYMYAIPVCAVFRRNTTAFDRNTNHNGGVASPGPSDRPDGLFSDIVDALSVADLRHGVDASWPLVEILQKNFNLLLDNNVQSEWTTTTIGGGVSGHTVLWADEIGVLPGDGITTGDTPGAEFIGEFDAARRSFSDRVIYETVTVQIDAPGGAWLPNAVVTIDPTALAIYPYAAFNWAAYNDAKVLFVDIVNADWIGPLGDYSGDALPYIASIEDLGSMPVTSVTLTMSPALPGALVAAPLIITLLVAYPAGLGLTKTPTSDWIEAITVNNPAQLPVAAPVSFSALAGSNGIDAPHREVHLQYETSTLLINIEADGAGVSSTVRLPERARSIVAVQRNAAPILGAVSLDSTGRVFTFNNVLDFTNPGDDLRVEYVAIRPLPQNGEQLTIYYPSRAPQAARTALLGVTLTVIPRVVGQSLFMLSTGSGSPGIGYPFPTAYVQLGGVYPSTSTTFDGDHQLNALSEVSVSEFSAETGQLHLPVFVPCVPNSQSLTFKRAPGDVDIEGRSFFKEVPSGYVPNSYGQGLSDSKRHRNALPMLAELAVDSALGRKGQLVLLLLLREALFDSDNFVAFDSDLAVNTTSAAVFRIKGALFNR